MDKTELHQFLVEKFSLEELGTLCFQLQVDFETIPGEGKDAKARNLVTFFERRDRLTELEVACKKLRPAIFTSGLPSSASENTAKTPFRRRWQLSLLIAAGVIVTLFAIFIQSSLRPGTSEMSPVMAQTTATTISINPTNSEKTVIANETTTAVKDIELTLITTSTLLPAVDLTRLPSSENEYLEVVSELGSGLPNCLVDPNARKLIYEEIMSQCDTGPVGAKIGLGQSIILRASGRSRAREPFLSNKIPIDILSYAPITGLLNVFVPLIGGGGSFESFEVTIKPPPTITKKMRIWAQLKSSYEKEWYELNREMYPKEYVKAVLTNKPMPDFFSLKFDETMPFEISLNFEEPGIYRLKAGIEFKIKNEVDILWADEEFEFYVFDSHIVWHNDLDLDNRVYQAERCEYAANAGYKCEPVNGSNDKK